jgi:formylglycine-generating enzyme
MLLLCVSGCHSIAGITDVTLATDATTDSALDTFTAETADDTSTSETAMPDGDAPSETPTGCASDRGPAMMEITVGPKKFCIDATEVTNAQFAEYAKDPGSPTLPAQCGGVVLTFPGKTGVDDAPQANVTWCDAFAFCRWAGKRLCGRLDPSKPIALDNSEWGYVCTQGRTTLFPYGDTFDSTACDNGRTAGDAVGTPVATHGNCTGKTPPYSDIYDLSGNVSEWVDECEGTTCRALGGFFGDTQKDSLRCASLDGTGATVAHPVAQIYSGLGFRCCR